MSQRAMASPRKAPYDLLLPLAPGRRIPAAGMEVPDEGTVFRHGPLGVSVPGPPGRPSALGEQVRLRTKKDAEAALSRLWPLTVWALPLWPGR